MISKPDDTFVSSAQPKSNGRAILILTADDTQDLEFFYPYYRLIEEGYRVDVVTPEGGEFKGKNGMGLKNTKAIKDVEADSYDLLYIPGGKAPEALKENDDALALAKRFAQSGKPIAAMCHGPQVLASAGLIEGRNIAAWPEIKDEIENAGANYTDEPAVVDGQFITARWPGDLPSYMARVLQVLQGSQSQKTQAGTRMAARN